MSMTKMRHLLLATVENPHDPKAWSGTPFNMLKALERNFDQVTVVSSPVPKRNWFDSILRLILGRKRYPLWMTTTALRAYGKRLDEAVQHARPDAILSISSQHLIYAKAHDMPVFMISDAPWIAYKEAYRDFEELPLRSTRYARLEAQAAKKISGVMYPTPWACKEAEVRFGLTAQRIKRLSFGANSHYQGSDEQIVRRIKQRKLEQLSFLFIGKDWIRKGGPLALAIVKELNARGLQVTLHIVGCQPVIPPDYVNHVQVHGYLSPSNPEDCIKMASAFAQADFFLVPSHAECFGLVFAEAQSYGLPCISLTSHGIPGVVDHKKTGLLFEPSVSAKSIADDIVELVESPNRYVEMATAARMKFTNDLNWDLFGRRMYVAIASH